MKRAIYAFSGDPITFGHIDIIERAAHNFDEVIVGIGSNPDKKYMFTLEERTDMALRSLENIPNAKVKCFSGLLVDFAYEEDVSVIVKGVRNSVDFNYENMLHQVGESQKLGIDTFILFARPELAHISSSAVKSILKEQGFVENYIPLYVKKKLEARMKGQYFLGVTGEIGTGKAELCNVIGDLARERGIDACHIDLDRIGQSILGELTEPQYQKVRNQVIEAFGEDLRLDNGMIDRKKLGQIVFNDQAALDTVNEIMHNPILVRLKRELYGKSGLIILNSALLVESHMTNLCNNNILLVNCDKEIQGEMLLERGFSQSQTERRLSSQYSVEEKVKLLNAKIKKSKHGKLWVHNNCGCIDKEQFVETFDLIARELGIL